MASTYSTSLRLELMATGDQSGTWGDTTNTNLGTLLEQAITGVLSVAQGDVANLTLTNNNGASDQARNAVINLTGAMTANRNVVVPTANKLYFVKNSTTGGFVITVKTNAGTGVTIPPSTGRWVYCDGTNVVDMYSGNFTPSSNDATALGASGVAWADLFLASGGVINWNAGDATITHSANALAFAGASSGYSFDALVAVAGSVTATGATPLTLTYTDAGASVGPVADLYRDSSSPAANDILGQLIFNGRDSANNKQEYASIEAVIADATSTSEDGDLVMYATVAGTRRRLFSINSTQALYGRPLPTISNNSTDATNDIDFSSGTANDLSTTATGLMWVACAAMTKQLDANWAAGTNQGMRYSGAAIANTTYHLWAAWTDAGTQDYYADPNADQATVLGHLQAESGGSSYTHIRRVASIIRSGGTILGITQLGNSFMIVTPITDRSSTSALSEQLVTLTVPVGINVYPIITQSQEQNSAGQVLTAFASAGADVTSMVATKASGERSIATFSNFFTNTSAQLKMAVTIISGTLTANQTITRGWIDTRGRDA